MNLTGLSAFALFMALWGIASEADYQDALASEADYCARLADGAHSDYLELREVCDDRY